MERRIFKEAKKMHAVWEHIKYKHIKFTSKLKIEGSQNT